MPDDEYTAGISRQPGQLERLLRGILPADDVPESMAYDLAAECDHLPAVEELVTRPHRGVATAFSTGYGLYYCNRAREAIEAYRAEQPTRHIVAIGCSASKVDHGPVAARELYHGAYWTCKRRYGEAAAEWRILSAKFGVLHPDVEVNPYERTVDDLRGVPVQSDETLPNGDDVTTLLDEWACRVHRGLRGWVYEAAGLGPAPQDVRLSVVLGERYSKPLRERGVFDLDGVAPAGLTVEHPFQELDFGGNGEQMSWLNEQAGVTA